MKCCVVNFYKELFMFYEFENYIIVYYDFIFFNVLYGLKIYICIKVLIKFFML